MAGDMIAAKDHALAMGTVKLFIFRRTGWVAKAWGVLSRFLLPACRRCCLE